MVIEPTAGALFPFASTYVAGTGKGIRPISKTNQPFDTV